MGIGKPGFYAYCRYCPYKKSCQREGRVIEPEACFEAKNGYYGVSEREFVEDMWDAGEGW